MAPTNEKVSIYVPDDVVFSILSKLPLKSVKRFTCMHKSWNLFFENPNFMNILYKNMISKYHSLYDGASLLLNHRETTDPEWKLHLLSGERFENKLQLNGPQPFNLNCGYILGSAINGILCIYDKKYEHMIVLWNPATEQFSHVPEYKARGNHEFEIHNNHGFGYDHVRDDYKIIQSVYYMGYDVEDIGPFWRIYSLKSNSWKELYVDMEQHYSNSSGSVYLNGVCHWWGKKWCRATVRETYVVSFNLYTQVPVTTLLPSDLHDLERADRHLTVLNGFVAMISRYVKNTSFHISVAILVQPGVNESWIKLFDLGPFSRNMHCIGAGMKGSIFFRKDDDEDNDGDANDSDEEEDELVCLDLTTGVIQNIDVKAESWRAQILLYKENILPIKGMHN
jgi:molecular chaperone HtpG